MQDKKYASFQLSQLGRFNGFFSPKKRSSLAGRYWLPAQEWPRANDDASGKGIAGWVANPQDYHWDVQLDGSELDQWAVRIKVG